MVRVRFWVAFQESNAPTVPSLTKPTTMFLSTVNKSRYSDMSGSSNSKSKNGDFDKYCSRLGYSSSMANDAKRKLGTGATTNDLLASVLNTAKVNNVQPNRSAQPGYLQKQVRDILENLAF
eukprot:sb/3476051/